MLFIGAQFIIWSVTGTYMVFFDIDYIHGDSLVVNHQQKINANNIQYSLIQLQSQYPDAKQVTVSKFINKDVYRFNHGEDKILVDASNGELLSPLTKPIAIKAAQFYYSGDGEVLDIELIRDNPPFELSPRALPAWRINFDNFGSPSIYVSAQTGQLVGKRHQFWRLFDWMFRFHVMDYEDGGDIDNLLLFCLTFLGSIGAVTGLTLTYFRVFKGSKGKLNLNKESNL